MDDVERDRDVDAVVVAAVAAFDPFFASEYRPVLGLAFVLSGSWHAAEELTMDAFEAALRHWDRISALDSPGAWVRKVVSNGAVSRFRRLAAEARAVTRLSARTEQPNFRHEDLEVWEAIRHLPRRQAQVVALFYVDGYPRRAIGQILGISDESVKTHLDRARPSLQRLLGETRE